MNKNSIDNKEQIFCIFNNDKEDINIQIEKSFIAYLKDSVRVDKKTNSFSNQERMNNNGL